MEPKKCETMGCQAEASWRMVYTLRADPEFVCSVGCTECIQGYMRRVIVRIISIVPFPVTTCI